MSIQLSDNQERLVRAIMEKGHYASPNEGFDDA